MVWFRLVGLVWLGIRVQVANTTTDTRSPLRSPTSSPFLSSLTPLSPPTPPPNHSRLDLENPPSNLTPHSSPITPFTPHARTDLDVLGKEEGNDEGVDHGERPPREGFHDGAGGGVAGLGLLAPVHLVLCVCVCWCIGWGGGLVFCVWMGGWVSVLCVDG
jgi:hypothetical protein